MRAWKSSFFFFSVLSSVRRRLDLPLVVVDVSSSFFRCLGCWNGKKMKEKGASKQGTPKEGTKERSAGKGGGDPTLVKLT
jgi:hypothetical protein